MRPIKYWATAPLQSKVLFLYAIAIALVISFPPFHFVTFNKMDMNVGYGFIITPLYYCFSLGDCRIASVNIQLILVEIFALSIIAFAAYLAARSTDQHRQKQADNEIKKNRIALSARLKAEKIMLEREKIHGITQGNLFK